MLILGNFEPHKSWNSFSIWECADPLPPEILSSQSAPPPPSLLRHWLVLCQWLENRNGWFRVRIDAVCSRIYGRNNWAWSTTSHTVVDYWLLLLRLFSLHSAQEWRLFCLVLLNILSPQSVTQVSVYLKSTCKTKNLWNSSVKFSASKITRCMATLYKRLLMIYYQAAHHIFNYWNMFRQWPADL